MIESVRSCATVRSSGELRLGGDWAQAHGDFEALRYIVQQLAKDAPESLHCKLAMLADMCLDDPDGAGEVWGRLKDELYRSATAAG